MTSRKSSSKIVLTHGSARTSSDSLSSRASSSTSSTSSNYSYSNYGYSSYETSAGSNMGRSNYSEKASSRPRESILRAPDAYPASKDGITKISQGSVDVINHKKRHEVRQEPHSSDAKGSDYHKSSSSRKQKK